MKKEESNFNVLEKVRRQEARKEKSADRKRAEHDEGADILDDRLPTARERHLPKHFVLEEDDVKELVHFVNSRNTDSSFPSYFDLW